MTEIVAGVARRLGGVATVYRRRGFRYVIYLTARVARLQLLYRCAWGPRAWRPIRMVFNAAAPLASTPASEAELRRAGLLTATPAGGPAAIDLGASADLMDRAHAAGITGLHDAFDRMGADASGAPRFLDVPGARRHRWRGAYYLAARDADRRTFNRRFRTSLLTEAEARRQLAILRAQIHNGYRDYAPIDFGGGLSMGLIASSDSGTGRWDVFNGRIVGPLVAGKRVLDLGCNNGSLTLMMLRAGAREVVGLEMTEAIADIARLNARILAWRDACRYRLTVITGDMRIWLTEDMGPFDVVTAFCSLYYLPETDMARIVRKAADMGATLVLQANDAIQNLPARADQLRRFMEQNGYETVKVSSFPGFARPLLVGTSARGRSELAG